MHIHFTKSSEWNKFSTNFIVDLKKSVEIAAEDTKKLLPNITDNVNIIVGTGDYVIYETGGMGWTYNKNLLILTVDPAFKGGRNIQSEYIRSTVYHELNHSSRFEAGYYSYTFIEKMIQEGLATVFERDKAGYSPLWGKYNNIDAKKWLKEIKQLGDTVDFGEYMYTHSDGRKWIGYKTGTYIVDQAIKKSKINISNLTQNYSYEEILNFADIK